MEEILEERKTEKNNGRRDYQDSVFRLLFGDVESAIELYNVLEGTNYGPDTEVIFTTLEDALYHGIKNDLGFLIDSSRYVMLSEHQSTINENMPMRQLQYAARTYEKLIDGEELYEKNRVTVPAPVFYVLYTGKKKWDKKMLRLSDSYEYPPGENSLELVVKIIDLRYNVDNEILWRSEKLRGYSYLIHLIRGNCETGMDLRRAIDLAVDQCIREDVLKEFLISHSSEVGSMLYRDISEERFWEIRMNEAERIGTKQGMEKGLKQGHEQGLQQGREEGLQQGREEASEQAIKNHITFYKQKGEPAEEVQCDLMGIFSLSEDEAKAYMEKYWK